MLTVDNLRVFLNLTEDDASNEELSTYIEYFSKEIAAKVGVPLDETLIENPLFDQALMAGIACHLSKINPELFTSPTKYEVGDTKLERAEQYYSKIPNWCDEYGNALEDLSANLDTIANVQVFRRKGLHRHPRWCHYIF